MQHQRRGLKVQLSVMEKILVEDKDFDLADFTIEPLVLGDYEKCRFINCNFSNSDLSGFHFQDCEFTGCNLGMSKLVKTAFRNVSFKDSKLLGLQFDACNEFLLEMKFDNCILNFSSFTGLKLKKTNFNHCQLQQVDFSGTDLTASVFDNCDLADATFESSILEQADLRTAYNYSIDPSSNKIKKAKFSLLGLAGLLGKYEIEIE